MIRLDDVGKRYPDGTVAVGSLSLDVAAGELLALVGPSGCGKSTTLRMVNRLVQPTSGRILLDGEDVTRTDPVRLRRRIGYVIQRVGLFPHRTVAQNVTTVPELVGWGRGRARDRAAELLDLVGLEPATYADRYPHELSGGQQQRVGVARALAADPPVLLMDEPFGAVDPLARELLQERFGRIQAELHKTVVLVTHDLDEAVRLGDRVAVLGPGGVLEQVTDPATLLAAPANERVAAFVGADAGVRRLAVTRLTREVLDVPPEVAADASSDQVRATFETAGTRRAVVLDGGGAVRGWLARDDVPRLVTSRVSDPAPPARPLPPPLALGADLRQAFGALAGTDSAWVPVLDGGRYVGMLTPSAIHRALRLGVRERTSDRTVDLRDPVPAEADRAT